MPKLFKASTLKQAAIALSFDLGGIISGRLIIIFSPFFASAPWILALFPPILTVRGNIGGILSGKLGTMLHTGEVEPRFRRNTSSFYALVKAIFALTFVDTLGIGFLAFVVNSLFFGAEFQNPLLFLLVPLLTCELAIAISVPVALFSAIESFKRGFDPDIILYPMMSTIDDVLVTACYIVVAGLALVPGMLWGMAIAALLLFCTVVVLSARNRKERTFARTLEEGAPIVIFSSLLGTFGGVALASLKDDIERHPSVLMLYPMLIDTLGDIGSILGAMQTTKLALGYAASLWMALKEAFADLLSVEAAAAAMHVVFGVASFAMGRATGLSPDIAMLVSLALISNAISFLSISILSLLVATQTFKHGLDPDNFVIPLVASVSDIIATLAFSTSLAVLGAG
ncbi:MAG: magnesium transporter [Candidatus Brockarchaeota archaeon]|nr:magnesium transporter [Candidatus Brockarchaeota archaeon]